DMWIDREEITRIIVEEKTNGDIGVLINGLINHIESDRYSFVLSLCVEVAVSDNYLHSIETRLLEIICDKFNLDRSLLLKMIEVFTIRYKFAK
ncbi:MAG TPA: hypothetical protein VGF79_12990, partial [Bacteroidia bacterium]